MAYLYCGDVHDIQNCIENIFFSLQKKTIECRRSAKIGKNYVKRNSQKVSVMLERCIVCSMLEYNLSIVKYLLELRVAHLSTVAMSVLIQHYEYSAPFSLLYCPDHADIMWNRWP